MFFRITAYPIEVSIHFKAN